MCVDCHVPHEYPKKLFVKAEKGIADAIAEIRGTISTQEKFDQERWRLANKVWDEMREDNSKNCRHCHDPQAMDNAKQIGRRRQAAQEVRLRQGHVHRLPHRRRAQGAYGAAAAGEGCLRPVSTSPISLTGDCCDFRRGIRSLDDSTVT